MKNITRIYIWVIAILAILMLLIVCFRIYVVKQLEEKGFRLMEEDPKKTVLAKENGIQRIDIQSGKNTIYGNWLEINGEAHSVFILHGDNENLSEWVDAQLLLSKLGYNSFVFDYSGYGSSQGKPSIKKLEEDAKNAWETYYKLSQKSSQRTALAHSLGCAILLASIDTYKPQPSRVILHAPFSSLREICVLFGYADSSWAWMIPDLWNNTKNISKTSNIPTCIVYSKTDEVVPFSMVEEISRNSKSAKLMTTDGYHHNALQIELDSTFWRQILDCSNN